MRNLEIGSILKRNNVAHHVKAFQGEVPVAGRLTKEGLEAANGIVAGLDKTFANSELLQTALETYHTQGNLPDTFFGMTEELLDEQMKEVGLPKEAKRQIYEELAQGVAALQGRADNELGNGAFQKSTLADDGTVFIRRCPFKAAALRWARPFRDAGLR